MAVIAKRKKELIYQILKVSMVFIFNQSMSTLILIKRAQGTAAGLIKSLTETFHIGKSTQGCASRGMFEELGLFVPPEQISVCLITIYTISPSGNLILLHPCYVTLDFSIDDLCLNDEEVKFVQAVPLEMVSEFLDFPEKSQTYLQIIGTIKKF